MRRYNVWVHVELVDDNEDIFEDIQEPECVKSFDTAEEALSFAEAISTAALLVFCEEG